MTAVIQIDEQYAQQFQRFMKTLPEKSVKLTLIKNNLDEEILKRVAEIKSSKVETKPLSELSWLRDRYVQS
jgi:K+/H+ antiporter YhaU regulatory subunit KhtT